MKKMKASTYEHAALIALIPVLGACATTSTPIPVVGDEPDLTVLDGRWEGSYESSESGRSGSITFELAAGSDTAHGNVIMVPSSDVSVPRQNEANERRAAPPPPRASRARPQLAAWPILGRPPGRPFRPTGSPWPACMR